MTRTTAVVILGYRPNEWLDGAIRSVTDQADDVVVVDNGSPGAVVSDVGRAAGARVLRLPENAGFAGGVNEGVAATDTDNVALLNDDASAGPDWLRHSAVVLQDPSVAAVAPKMLFAFPWAEVVCDDEPFFAPGDPRPLGRRIDRVTVAGRDVLDLLIGPGIHKVDEGQLDGRTARWRWTAGAVPFYVPLGPGEHPSQILINGEATAVTRVTDVVNNAGSYLTADGYGGDCGYGCPDDGTFDTAGDRFGACGGAMVFRRETWERVGPMASRFFAYYEDVDWCWRAQLLGYRIRYEPGSVVRHVGGATSGGLRNLEVRNLSARNRLVCLTRNAPLRVAWRQVRAEVLGVPPVGLRRAPLAVWLPRALSERARLRRQWQRSPAEVWDQWAGVLVPAPT